MVKETFSVFSSAIAAEKVKFQSPLGEVVKETETRPRLLREATKDSIPSRGSGKGDAKMAKKRSGRTSH